MRSDRFAEDSQIKDTADPVSLDALREVLGVSDLDPGALEHALTHRSYAYENPGVPNNERLEFLGDSVLGLVITDALFSSHPDLPEGQLAKLRAAVVSAKALAEVARTLDLGTYLLVGRGEAATGGRDKASILSDAVEAVIGAIYVQFGIERAAEVIHRVFDPFLARATELGAGLDWKTSLQEICADESLGVPEYSIASEGPDHDKTFTARVYVRLREYGAGVGRSKKEAEQHVAEIAWRSLREEVETIDPIDA